MKFATVKDLKREKMTKYENMIKLEISQVNLKCIVELVEKHIEYCGDITIIKFYLPLYNYLEDKLRKEKL